MARPIYRLSARKLENAPLGMHADGGGLYLQVTSGSNEALRRSWIYRYAINGREHHMGLGSLTDIGLADARQKAADARKLKAQGQDPIEAVKATRAAAAKAKAKSLTFDQCRDAYIASFSSSWRNAKHASQWTNTLKTYATPIIGKVIVRDIDTDMVMQILEPIWNTKTDTAKRLRGRIESILDWAKVLKRREGDNPARWRGHLDKLLAAPADIRKVRHHPALPFDNLPAFLIELRKQDGIAARAMEFTILTAARTSETIGATTAEITKNIWIIPNHRMKGGREHRVPLCDRALEIINDLASSRGEAKHLFPSGRGGGALSNMAMAQVLNRMKREDITVHGFRSTFRDWAAERTNYPNEVVEMALAHAVGDKVEAAYRRSDLFDKRRRLMEAWAEFCEHGTIAAEIVSLRA
jgi:integrase